MPRSYLEALIGEAFLCSSEWEKVKFDSIYFGGGTPSLLGVDQVALLLEILKKLYMISESAEITLESNPATLDNKSLRELRALGINRLSAGVQSLDSRDLAVLGRIHTPMDSIRLLNDALEAGFENLSADLIIGIPGQSHDSLEWTIRKISGMVDHISAYILSIEPGTILMKMIEEGKIDQPSEAELVWLYNLASQLLEELGFERYEISNWCKSNKRSCHNLNYWLRGDYLGIGAGAHSHRKGIRSANVSDWQLYVQRIHEGSYATELSEILDEEEKIIEEVGLGLRTSEGLDLDSLIDRLIATDFCDVSSFLTRVDLLCREGYLIHKDGRIVVSKRGIVVENELVTYLLASPKSSHALF